MHEHAMPYKKIVFVCVNQRPSGERVCCAGGGGLVLYAKLKNMIKERGLRGRVRVSKAGCLNRCEDGPNIMVFPDNVWYSHVAEADLEPLVTRLVESLRAEGQLPRNYGG